MSASRIRRRPAAWTGAALAVLLAVGGCAASPASSGGSAPSAEALVPEEPPFHPSTPTPSPTPTPEESPEPVVCQDASPAALAAVNASIAADPGPYPGVQVTSLETRWDDEEEVWTLAGMITPLLDEQKAGAFVALWATDQDPTRPDFAGEIWSAANGASMVSAAPELELYPQGTLEGPSPTGIWCPDLYPAESR